VTGNPIPRKAAARRTPSLAIWRSASQSIINFTGWAAIEFSGREVRLAIRRARNANHRALEIRQNLECFPMPVRSWDLLSSKSRNRAFAHAIAAREFDKGRALRPRSPFSCAPRRRPLPALKVENSRIGNTCPPLLPNKHLHGSPTRTLEYEGISETIERGTIVALCRNSKSARDLGRGFSLLMSTTFLLSS
jgi:hypothetical protein